MTWQPIETAPKGGTEILVWNNGTILHVRWGGDFHNAWMLVHGIDFADHATHWMPLPEPPKGAAQ